MHKRTRKITILFNFVWLRVSTSIVCEKVCAVFLHGFTLQRSTQQTEDVRRIFSVRYSINNLCRLYYLNRGGGGGVIIWETSPQSIEMCRGRGPITRWLVGWLDRVGCCRYAEEKTRPSCSVYSAYITCRFHLISVLKVFVAALLNWNIMHYLHCVTEFGVRHKRSDLGISTDLQVSCTYCS